MRLVYQNPVHASYMADPFILKHENQYYAYGTTPRTHAGERAFSVLRSPDLVTWQPIGGVLDLLPERQHLPLELRRHYWAPEVAVQGKVFHLFYSASSGACPREGMIISTQRLRMATASRPEGPFRDQGPVFPGAEFCIDPHPFRDPRSGRWYLYFASNFFDARPGTGICVVPLGDDLKPCGPVVPALRACADWHIYERNQLAFGQVWDAWHTVEGPHVTYHNGRYYCFYSGGAWMGGGYGVGYGVADHPLGPWHDEWAHEGASVLRGDGTSVIGPGHNSLVLGPDNETLFMVYHAWDAEMTARRMCIDPLVWTPDGRPRCDGPSTHARCIPPGPPQRFKLIPRRSAMTVDACS